MKVSPPVPGSSAKLDSYLTILKCLCDPTRLRILNLLKEGPLCVCHFQDILGEPQPKMSKQLGYLKRHGLIESFRRANWTVYRLPRKPSPLLEQNLRGLRESVFQDAIFLRDLERRRRTDTSAACLNQDPGSCSK